MLESDACALEACVLLSATSLDVEPHRIRTRTRIPAVVIARQLAMVLARRATAVGTVAMGEWFGGFSAACVTYSQRAVRDRARRDVRVARALDESWDKLRTAQARTT